MTIRLNNARKSTYSAHENCVEVGNGQLDGVAVAGFQDTKQRDLGDDRDQVVTSMKQYESFLSAVRAGKFDR